MICTVKTGSKSDIANLQIFSTSKALSTVVPKHIFIWEWTTQLKNVVSNLKDCLFTFITSEYYYINPDCYTAKSQPYLLPGGELICWVGWRGGYRHHLNDRRWRSVVFVSQFEKGGQVAGQRIGFRLAGAFLLTRRRGLVLIWSTNKQNSSYFLSSWP